jgi:hypothetical protein
MTSLSSMPEQTVPNRLDPMPNLPQIAPGQLYA